MDPTWSDTRRRRDRLVIPGVTLAFYALACLVYIATLRAPDVCQDPGKFFVADTCFRAWPLLVAVLVVALGIATAGWMAFQPPPRQGRERLEHGTVARLALVFLASIPSLALTGYIIQSYRSIDNGTTFIVTFDGTPYNQASLLLLATLVGVGAFLPYVLLYVSQTRRVRAFDLTAEARQAGYPREVPPGAPVEPTQRPVAFTYDQDPSEKKIARLSSRSQEPPAFRR